MNQDLIACKNCSKDVLPGDYDFGASKCIWCQGAGQPVNPHKTATRF